METNMNRKIEQAKEYLGTHWVLAKNSTYNAKRREQGMCATLRPVVIKAMKAGRI